MSLPRVKASHWSTFQLNLSTFRGTVPTPNFVTVTTPTARRSVSVLVAYGYKSLKKRPLRELRSAAEGRKFIRYSRGTLMRFDDPCMV